MKQSVLTALGLQSSLACRRLRREHWTWSQACSSLAGCLGQTIGALSRVLRRFVGWPSLGHSPCRRDPGWAEGGGVGWFKDTLLGSESRCLVRDKRPLFQILPGAGHEGEPSAEVLLGHSVFSWPQWGLSALCYNWTICEAGWPRWGEVDTDGSPPAKGRMLCFVSWYLGGCLRERNQKCQRIIACSGA